MPLVPEKDAALVAALQRCIAADPFRLAVLTLVRTLALPDCWVGAGFVRDAIWDHLHGMEAKPPTGDVDILWFNRADHSAETDKAIERRLAFLAAEQPALAALPIRWSVKNQARMHVRNGDAPYTNVHDAMRFWPETATAIALRLDDGGTIQVSAPYGLADLFALHLRATPPFHADKRRIFTERVLSKQWLERYPQLSIVE